MTETTHRAYLENIATVNPPTIKSFVAKEALEYSNISDFFNDLSKNGCVSGMVGSLIYYNQTHQFFEEHYDEIEEIRLQYEEESGMQLSIEHDLKNTLAWFAFEQTAFHLATELNIQ